MPAGVVFVEQMSGELAPIKEVSLPPTRAILRGTVTIPSLQAFLDDPNHQGKLNGAVRIVAFSKDWFPACGYVRLFSMGARPGERWMEYHVEFDNAGAQHTLAGRKIVRDDKGFDTWADVTTLFVEVTRLGVDGATPLYSGVMRLSLYQAARLMTTLRGSGGTRLRDRLGAPFKFSLFFVGQVLARYLPARSRREPRRP